MKARLRRLAAGVGRGAARVARPPRRAWAYLGKHKEEVAVVASVLTALVVVTPVALLGVAWAWDQIRPGPDAAEEKRLRLIKDLKDRSFWRVVPEISARARSYLETEWDALNPYWPHRFDGEGARDVAITDLLVDRRLDGRSVRFGGYVGQVHQYGGDLPGSTRQKYEVATSSGLVWCMTTSHRAHQVVEGEHVEVLGTVLMRGTSREGEYVAILACPALRRKPYSAAEREVNEYYEWVRGNSVWDDEPAMSETSREFLARTWGETSPYRRNRFVSGYSRPSIAGLSENVLLDGRLIEMSGYVESEETIGRVDGRPDLVTQAFSFIDGATAVHCVGARPVSGQLRNGDAVAFTGVAVARGTWRLSGGGFQRVTWVACNSIYRFP